MNKPRISLTLVALLLILIAGAAVRLHSIGAESIDLEEYACVGGVHAPTWRAFFEGQRVLYPYGAPLAPSLIYLWTRVVPPSILNIRLLFAFISILSIPLCFWLAQVVFRDWDQQQRSRAGLVTALCFAFSPVHVFHAQEARMYALVSLFTLLSMGAFLRALYTGNFRWWCLHIFAVLALGASHYFTVFLLPVQGLLFLLWDRRISLRLLAWGAAQCMLMLLLVWWVSRIPRQAEDLYSYYGMPSLKVVLAQVFAGDSATLSANSFFPSPEAWDWLPFVSGSRIRPIHGVFDAALILSSAGALLATGLGLVRAYRRKTSMDTRRTFLLLAWALLPTLIMVVISFAWQPIYGSRYVLYSIFAYYLIFGGIAARLRHGWAFVLALLVLVTLYGYQLGLALPAHTRTAWRQAQEQMHRESTGKPVLLLEDCFWLNVLKINDASTTPPPVAAAFTRETLCDAAGYLRASAPEGIDLWVLLVLTTNFDEGPFAQCLAEKGLNTKRTWYPGERRLALYHILPGEAAQAAPKGKQADTGLFMPLSEALATPEQESERAEFENQVKYVPDDQGGFWLRLGTALAASGHHTVASSAFWRAAGIHGGAAVQLLQLARRLEIPLNVEAVARCMLDQVKDGQDACLIFRTALQQIAYARETELLERFGLAVLTHAPQCAEGSAFIALAMHQQEQHNEALIYFRQAYMLNPAISPEITEAYGISLTASQVYQEAISVLQDGISRWPEYSWLHMRLGIALAALSQHREALAEFKIALESTPNDFYIQYLTLQSLIALEQYGEAADRAADSILSSRNESWVHLDRWRAFVGAGRHEKAREALGKTASLNADFKELYECLYDKPDGSALHQILKVGEREKPALLKELRLAVDWFDKQ